MGGLMSFFAVMMHPQEFGFVLSFSPALFFYEEKDWLNISMKYKVEHTEEGRCYLYSGGTGFEAKFVKDTFDAFMHLTYSGYNSESVKLVINTSEEHNEKAWAKYLPDAFRFWLRDKKN